MWEILIRKGDCKAFQLSQSQQSRVSQRTGVEPTKPSKPENRVEPSKPTEPQKQIEPPKTVNQISLIEILIAMFVNGIAVPSMQLITSIWQLILQFIKMLLTAAF